MSNIELVVKIDEELFEKISEYDGKHDVLINRGKLYKAIKNGTPLPKGHGRLIDVDEIDDNIYDLTRSMDLDYGQISNVLDDAPTIIEADTGE